MSLSCYTIYKITNEHFELRDQ